MNTWEQFSSWNLVLPPSRPSSGQLRLIAEVIRDINRETPVAILGSTPEFRDLLHEKGFTEIFVLEKNLGFHRLVSKERIYQNRETLVKGDWLETLPNNRARFSLILSDLTSGNIEYGSRRDFYEFISAALASGGVFVDKILTHPSENLKVEDLIEKYQKLPLNLLHVNHFSCEMLFCSELLDEELVVDTTRFYEYLDGAITTPRLRAFAAASQWITPRRCRWYYGQKWRELESSYCPNLRRTLIKPDDPDSPYFGRLFHYVFTKGVSSV